MPQHVTGQRRLETGGGRISAKTMTRWSVFETSTSVVTVAVLLPTIDTVSAKTNE
jgi:hypothetical protein